MHWSSRFGPGLLVTAAFIGPGTITTASVAGALFQYSLLWVLFFAVVATIVLQEMSARLGLITRAGLGEALRGVFANPWLRALAVALVVGAIALGNAAFQWGNVAGASVGLEALTGVSRRVWACAVGGGVCILLYRGGYRWIERVLVSLVAVMSLMFLLTAVTTRPQIGQILHGMFVPHLSSASLKTALALIGTTVVPYNLFLHASSVCEKWPAALPKDRALKESRLDTVVAVTIGGVITLAMVTTAAPLFQQGITIERMVTMARQLQPLLGPSAKVCFAIGLAGAGLTSAITAPLAAAYAVSGALGWKADLTSWKFRTAWFGVLLVGTVFACTGYKPVSAILLAQALNGLLLPLIAVFLLVVMNHRRLLGAYINGAAANFLGTLVVLITMGLGITRLVHAIGKISG